jgi:RHS repeat-associated protein
MQGAGGVGGLLAVNYQGSAPTNCFAVFDGNGNVAGLVNAADGTYLANYEYGPFGEVIRATGPMAKTNPIRFSTKYADDESDLVYYGYRYYKPSVGTWINRDPIQESGGINLYEFVANQPIIAFDKLGFYGNPVITYVPTSDGANDMGQLDGSYWLAVEFKLDSGSAMFSKVTQDGSRLTTCTCPALDANIGISTLYSFTAYTDLFPFQPTTGYGPKPVGRNYLVLSNSGQNLANVQGVMTITLEYAITPASPVPPGFFTGGSSNQGQHSPSSPYMPLSWLDYNPRTTITFTASFYCGKADTTSEPRLDPGLYRSAADGYPVTPKPPPRKIPISTTSYSAL